MSNTQNTPIIPINSVNSVNSMKIYSFEMNHKNENNEYQVLVIFDNGKNCVYTLNEYRNMIKSGKYIDERIKPLYHKMF